MASISRQPNGYRTLQYVGQDQKRRSIRLGKIDGKQADRIRLMVESLIAAKISGFPPGDDVSRWLSGLDEALFEKLSAVGLVAPRDSQKLGPYLEAYIMGRTDVQRGTRLMYQQAQRALVDFLGHDRNLKTITPGDADDWFRWMTQRGWSPNTCRKRAAIAKLFFGAAVRKKLIGENPFLDLKGTVRPNEARLKFISSDVIQSVLNQTSDPEWRLIIALARYAGLRTPSETLSLKWEDIQWGEGRMVVWSPKAAHHVGKDVPRGSDLPGASSVFGTGLRGRSRSGGACDRKTPCRMRKLAYADAPVDQAGRNDPMDPSVPQPAGLMRDRTG